MKRLTLIISMILVFAGAALAQTTAFTYQGKLTDGGSPPTGQYDFVFKLYDQVDIILGTQIGSDILSNDVQVTAGIFTVNLDFGASSFTSGADRYLQISVRPGASTGAYTPLAPLQPLTSSPFSIKSLSATSADSLSCVLCVIDGHIVSIDGSKVTGTVNNATNAALAENISGVVQIANGGTGSTTQNFVDLSTNQRRIGGDKEFVGAVSVAGTNGVFNGNGSGLYSLNGANINSGSVATNSIADGSVTKPKLSTNYKNGFDPQLVATQRWDLIPVQRNSVTVGRRPSGLAFDGTFIWVSNKLDNNVIRIRASTGLVEGSPIAVGTAPSALAFDGTFIYVAISAENSVRRIRAGTGELDASIPVCATPSYLTFDGAYMNVACTGSNSVTRIDVNSGSTGNPIGVNYMPVGMVFDGTYVYVASTGGGNSAIQRINASTGDIGQTAFPNRQWRSVGFDGTFVYGLEIGGFTRLRASTGVVEFIPISVNNLSGPVTFDGTYIYALSVEQIKKINVNSLGAEGSIGHMGMLTAFGFDGTYVYAALDFIDPNGGGPGIPATINGSVIRF